METVYKVIVNDEGTFWYNEKNELHRLDGPAIKYSNGTKHWYINDCHHRLDGPAIEYSNGERVWYKNNEYHRLDGPAMECKDGTRYWFINGKQYTEEEFNTYIQSMNKTYTIQELKKMTLDQIITLLK